jgi:hypothetical protein
MKTEGVPHHNYWKRLIDIETEEFCHYFVQVLRMGQVIWGLYFAHGRTELLALTRRFMIHLAKRLTLVGY